MKIHLFLYSTLCSALLLSLTGCSKDAVVIPSDTAVAAVPPAPQVMGNSASTGNGKPGLAK
ncbi:MAG TPA: hypothetical protein PKA06_03390 [Gemmatales bacterium]|nr:hypothetical protein [Gemmatales bacterium]HMP16176.1 hypothetical protein [Gemmatales bacterium]